MENRIRELRIERGLNQNELAPKAKISSRHLCDIELNKCDTTTAVLDRIAIALNTTISYLLYESEEKDRRRYERQTVKGN